LQGSAATLAAAAAVHTDVYTDVVQAQADPPPSMRSAQGAILQAAAGLPELPPVAVIALNRMAFGPRPEDWKTFRDLGSDDTARLTAYVDRQLAPQTIDDSACDAILAAQGFTTLGKSPEQLWADHVTGDQDRYAPAREIERATFLRAVYSKRQLVEVLADYWHNHFNVHGWEYRIAPVFVHYDRDVIRKHLLGNFRQMLGAVAKSPAMIYYLDNQSNSGDRPNENYARELHELHVMGAENYLGVAASDDPALVDGSGNRIGYIDADVYGATTCFTGWRVDEETGRFTFDEARHFPYAKLVMGKIIPEFQGIKDGEDVLDLLASHPGAARYICRRLCRRLLADTPPARVVEEAAAVFIAQRNAADQLKQVVRTILLSPEFRNTWGEKLKRPFEYSVSILRGLNADFTPTDAFFWSYDAIGQDLFDWAPPNGYPDDRVAWSGTMALLQRWRHGNWLFGWTYGGDGPDKDRYRLRPEEQMPNDVRTPSAIVDFWSQRLLGRLLPPEERGPLVDFMAFGRNPDMDLPDDQVGERLRHLVTLLCLAPAFQWR
jgi:uncharacterized protein (DUF1800 family)